METFHILVLGFSAHILLAAVFIFLKHFSACGKFITSCCGLLCDPESTHQTSHLDSCNLRVHYKNPGTGVTIEGLTNTDHCNITLDIEDNTGVDHESTISLSPLPLNIRDKCPSSACQVSYN